MSLVCVHDRARLAACLGREAGLHLYELGDLESPLWEQTLWYGWQEEGALQQVALLFMGAPRPLLLALGSRPAELVPLLEGVLPGLPRRFDAHMSPGLAQVLHRDYAIVNRGHYVKMVLEEPATAAPPLAPHCEELGPADAAGLVAFYDRAHPGHWFEPQQLATGLYRGIRRRGQIVSAGGVHLVSDAYGVAALGNIATHPDHRGRGYGTAVVWAVVQALRPRVGLVGLNVSAANAAALRLYGGLGFRPVGEYDDLGFEAL